MGFGEKSFRRQGSRKEYVKTWPKPNEKGRENGKNICLQLLKTSVFLIEDVGLLIDPALLKQRKRFQRQSPHSGC